MSADLLERDHELLALDTLLGEVMAGEGRIALVSGEAGIGKTALVERFATRARARQPSARLLWGACEALFAPRPLGPFYDIAQQAPGPLRALLESDANRAALFGAVLDDLISSPSMLVVEDIHWADEATLDLIKYLARRIARTAALLILTYREEELSRDHPLRLVLGDMPVRTATRLRLLPLSEVAVAALARQDRSRRSTRQLYVATGGNPFFLAETLASDAPGVPTSVSDAVLARLARRSPEAQRLLEVVAVAPGRIERWVVEALGAGDIGALDECLATQMLRLDGQAIAFRHELARQAVEGSLPPARRQTLNAQILHAMLASEGEPASLARLAHHAAQAEDAALVLRFAPEAARQAAARKAHREAIAHYQTALRYADRLDAEQRAILLDELTTEFFLTGRMEEAEAPCEAALALWRALDRTEQIGRDLRQASAIGWYLGRNAESERYLQMAVELLETLPPGRELARACAAMSGKRMVMSDNAGARTWGMRALELAERLDDAETLSQALNSMGSSEMCSGYSDGQALLERSLRIAKEHGLERLIAIGYSNLTSSCVEMRAYEQTMRYVREGMAYCAEHDLDLATQCLRGDWAHVRLDQGDWAGADEEVTAILSVPWLSPASRIIPLTMLGFVRARRGDPGVETLLDELRDLALPTGEMQNIAPMAAARAEWRWLQGDLAGCATEARIGVAIASHLDHPWDLGEVAIWLWRGDGSIEVLDEVAEPFALEMSGDWRAAADAWKQIGCPYEQALALLDGDEAAQREALAIFERLGARPAAEITRRRLRHTGVRRLPRGPRPATQANPYGLTARQLEILLLLAEGLHNNDIADRLSTTSKTVEHHVTAVLAKLHARSRAEAVRLAHDAGLIPQPATPSTANLGV
jgi:DNA-binding CsgD family transcriptional regulator